MLIGINYLISNIQYTPKSPFLNEKLLTVINEIGELFNKKPPVLQAVSRINLYF